MINRLSLTFTDTLKKKQDKNKQKTSAYCFLNELFSKEYFKRNCNQ